LKTVIIIYASLLHCQNFCGNGGGDCSKAAITLTLYSTHFYCIVRTTFVVMVVVIARKRLESGNNINIILCASLLHCQNNFCGNGGGDCSKAATALTLYSTHLYCIVKTTFVVMVVVIARKQQ